MTEKLQYVYIIRPKLEEERGRQIAHDNGNGTYTVGLRNSATGVYGREQLDFVIPRDEEPEK